MNKANIFIAAGWIGLVGLVVSSVSYLGPSFEPIGLVGGIVSIAACWVMLFSRGADEYTKGLWTSAASLAFAALLILFIALPFFEGLYDGYTSARADDGAVPKQDIPASASIALAIIAFYIGLFWKRIRGGV